jgi:hypothetical protein
MVYQLRCSGPASDEVPHSREADKHHGRGIKLAALFIGFVVVTAFHSNFCQPARGAIIMGTRADLAAPEALASCSASTQVPKIRAAVWPRSTCPPRTTATATYNGDNTFLTWNGVSATHNDGQELTPSGGSLRLTC